MSEHAVLLFDGHCGLCSGTVRFVLRHERRHTLRFAPLGGATAEREFAAHPELADVDSAIWIESIGDPAARVHVGSEAALRLAEYLGGPWRVLSAARMVPRSWRDRLYDFVARHRHAVFERAADGFVPTVELLDRFLE